MIDSLRKTSRSLFMAAMMMVTVWTTAYAAPAHLQAPGAKPSPSATPAPPPFYKSYLQKPESLGFKPDATLFQKVLSMVVAEHPDKPTLDKLYGGVETEVAELLKEAHVAATGVKEMPRNNELPAAIESRYAGKVDKSLLWFAMIRGLLEGTGDPYSVLMPPSEFSMMMKSLRDESFAGVGIVIELDKDNKNALTVVEPLDGTPAARAGLQAGDVITRIDGKPTVEMALDSDVTAIRGPAGSKVTLTVQRKGQALKDYGVIRAKIEVPSVTSKMLPNQMGYVRLRVFGENTGHEFDQAVDGLLADGAKSIIIDLRNNGGGYLTAADEVCSHFISPGQVVTQTRNKAGDRRDEVAAEGHTRIHVPVVLLVNGYSASASEITAGCLKDNKAATLIGVKTFGKGSVQQLFPLPHDAALKLTVAHFFTPEGHIINHVGVTPDIVIPMEARYVGNMTGKDVQLNKAIQYLTTMVRKS
jgi:carboxyl-terminal processing protease